jgi:hypothetical protein
LGNSIPLVAFLVSTIKLRVADNAPVIVITAIGDNQNTVVLAEVIDMGALHLKDYGPALAERVTTV